MNCKISCGFGEVVDKLTILKIKSKKIKNEGALKNIILELKTIQEEIPLVNNNDELFNELHNINQKLWILEDIIREKGKNKIFDDTYIKIAESIHKTNDKRSAVKKKINIKYNSEIIEEKSYNQQNEIIIDTNGIQKLENGKQLYMEGNYTKSYEILNKLMIQYTDYTVYDNFFC